MDYRTINWDRQKLYEAVWEKPAVQLAKEYGVSDVAIAKVCKKLNIPKPGLGYWRRKELGFKVQRKPLPPDTGCTSTVSRVPVRSTERQDPIPEEFIVSLKPARVVSTRHETVRQTARAYAKGSTDRFGRLYANGEIPHFKLGVTKSGLTRALSFMDELVKLLEANGILAKATIKEYEPSLFYFEVDSEKIGVLIREAVRGKKREITVEERRARFYFRDQNLVWDYEPKGLLTFEITNYSNAQRAWTDTKRHKIEEHVHEIVFGLRAAAAFEKQRRIELEAQKKREAEEQRRRWKQQERIDRLKRNLACWEEAERIRAYLAVVRKKAEQREGPLKEGSLMLRCLTWGERYANSIDPSDGLASPDWAEDI